MLVFFGFEGGGPVVKYLQDQIFEVGEVGKDHPHVCFEFLLRLLHGAQFFFYLR